MTGKRTPSMLVAVYLLLLRDAEVLLLRRYNTGYEDGNYGVIAGHVEEGEGITQALIREAAEEAGITVRETALRFVHVMQRHSGDDRVYVDFFFVAEQWDGDVQNCEPSKCDALRWFPLRALPLNTVPYIKKVLETLPSVTPGFSEYR